MSSNSFEFEAQIRPWKVEQAATTAGLRGSPESIQSDIILVAMGDRRAPAQSRSSLPGIDQSFAWRLLDNRETVSAHLKKRMSTLNSAARRHGLVFLGHRRFAPASHRSGPDRPQIRSKSLCPGVKRTDHRVVQVFTAGFNTNIMVCIDLPSRCCGPGPEMRRDGDAWVRTAGE